MSANLPTRTPSERHEDGRSRRKLAPRSSFAEWRPSPDRADPVALLEAAATTRVPELVPIRHGRMLTSSFAFYRAGAEIMGGDLATTPQTGLATQLCGDAHLSNFGGFAAPDRKLVFDCNDFDETIAGPWEWDVMRLAASFEIAGRSLGIAKRERREIVASAVARYRLQMGMLAERTNLDVWYERMDVDALIAQYGRMLDAGARKRFEKNRRKALAKDSMRAFSKLTEVREGAIRIVAQPPLIVPVDQLNEGRSEEETREFFEHLISRYRETLSDAAGALLDTYHYVDAARKVVGVGSVGTRCWIVLMLGRDEGDPLFLQVKQAEDSALAPHLPRSRFRHQGRRVVEGQRLMQAAGDIFLGWLSAHALDGENREFYVRQLWDGKASANVEVMNASLLTTYGELCGATLARAHARGGDRIAIAGYLGRGTTFDDAMTRFAATYADQNERDFEAFEAAVAGGRLEAVPDER